MNRCKYGLFPSPQAHWPGSPALYPEAPYRSDTAPALGESGSCRCLPALLLRDDHPHPDPWSLPVVTSGKGSDPSQLPGTLTPLVTASETSGSGPSISCVPAGSCSPVSISVARYRSRKNSMMTKSDGCSPSTPNCRRAGSGGQTWGRTPRFLSTSQRRRPVPTCGYPGSHPSASVPGRFLSRPEVWPQLRRQKNPVPRPKRPDDPHQPVPEARRLSTGASLFPVDHEKWPLVFPGIPGFVPVLVLGRHWSKPSGCEVPRPVRPIGRNPRHTSTPETGTTRGFKVCFHFSNLKETVFQVVPFQHLHAPCECILNAFGIVTAQLG